MEQSNLLPFLSLAYGASLVLKRVKGEETRR